MFLFIFSQKVLSTHFQVNFNAGDITQNRNFRSLKETKTQKQTKDRLAYVLHTPSHQAKIKHTNQKHNVKKKNKKKTHTMNADKA